MRKQRISKMLDGIINKCVAKCEIKENKQVIQLSTMNIMAQTGQWSTMKTEHGIETHTHSFS